MADSNGGWIAVVSGLPRSGTSMMMKMLEAGNLPVLTDSIRKPDADNPNGYYEFEPVKKLDRDASWLEGARGKAVKMVYMLVYKLPKNYRYKIVFMRRKFDEVIASQDAMLQRHGKGGDGLEEARLRGLFDAELRNFDRWVRDQAHIDILYMDYNRMMDDTQTCVAEINRFFDERLDAAAMARVCDPSLYRQRR